MSRIDTLYPEDPETLVRVEDVARATGRTPQSILSYIAKGILPAVSERQPGNRGRPRKMVRKGDIFLIAFRPRWENRRKKVVTKSGYIGTPTSVPDTQ